MARIVFRPDPNFKETEEDKKRGDLAWEMFCKHGAVCINDPSQPVERLSDIVKNNPYAFTGPGCDYHGDIPLKEFMERAKNGEFDPK